MKIKSATIILQRSSGEVLLCKRSRKVSFFPGAWVFPGGKLDEDLESWEGDEKIVRDTALREAYEEVGLILGQQYAVAPEKRNGKWDGEMKSLELRDRIIYLGRRQTPPFDIKQYDTSYFLLQDTFFDNWVAIPDGQEIVDTEWILPGEVIQQFESGKRHIPPPVLYTLRLLAKHGTQMTKYSLKETTKPPGIQTPIEFSPRFEVIPLPADTAPPFTTTNLGIIRGRDVTLLIDPGWNKGLTWLSDILQTVKTKRVDVFITHHHRDHWAGLSEFEKYHPNSKVYMHPLTAEKVETGLEVIKIEEEQLDLGEVEVEIVHAPGHTAGHMILIEKKFRTVYAGDHVVGRGTSLLDPSDGDMKAYLSTLDLIEGMNPKLLIPSHGRPIFNPSKRLEYYRKHRLEREEQIIRSIKNGATDVEKILQDVYADVQKKFWKYARYNIYLHVKKLISDNRIREEDGVLLSKD